MSDTGDCARSGPLRAPFAFENGHRCDTPMGDSDLTRFERFSQCLGNSGCPNEAVRIPAMDGIRILVAVWERRVSVRAPAFHARMLGYLAIPARGG